MESDEKRRKQTRWTTDGWGNYNRKYGNEVVANPLTFQMIGEVTIYDTPIVGPPKVGWTVSPMGLRGYVEGIGSPSITEAMRRCDQAAQEWAQSVTDSFTDVRRELFGREFVANKKPKKKR